jgi:hypothetical protein
VTPGYVPFALLFVLEMSAVFVWVLVFARRRPDLLRALLVCPRCARLHERAEAVARVADAIAVGALAFLVALPFVAAGYESRLAFPQILLAISAVVAVLAIGAEAEFFARAVVARLLPSFTWSVDPARLIGGGARWLGVILALYLFQHPDLPGRGIAGLFGGVGERLARDLPSTAAIYVAATLVLFAAIVALAARWLLPFALNSLPLTMAASREPHGRSV